MAKTRVLDSAYRAYLADPVSGQEALLAAVLRRAQAVLRDDDQAQEFIVGVWNALPGLEIRSTFEGWVNTRLSWHQVNAAVAAKRNREDPPPALFGDDDQPLTDEEVLDILAYRAAPKSEPEADTSAIGDPFLRQVAELLLEGHSQDETAAKLGLKPATLRKRLQRHRESLPAVA